MIKVNKKNIQARKQVLEDCKAFLKKQFIGIDGIIDDLLDYLQIWYLMPDILNRPVIVNLWGMTGVGKTDLIRKMVKFLDFQDRFTEVELSNVDETSWNRSVSQILTNQGFNDGKPSIVLFDEIQRFNTLDADGKPMPQTKFTDFWELLSDGKLSKKDKEDLDYYLYNYMMRKKENDRKKAAGEEVVEKPVIDVWDAKSLKSSLGMEGDIMDLSQMSQDDMINQIVAAKKKKKIYEPVDYSKTLIIISGNLDDAFQMAQQTSEADVDADIFHAYTKKITVVDVKNALTRKFRPEQVARFGNIHLIYNSLRKVDFDKLIQREIDRIKRETKEKIGITLTVTKNINSLIYRNGVFPVQGVRPVFSSVIDILDSNLSKLVFEAIMQGALNVTIDYDEAAKKLVGIVGKKVINISYVGRIDKIRQSNEIDTVANISVHESGHAVVYMLLTGMAPLQLKSKVASSYAGGFTFPHLIHETKENIVNKVKIYLAGGIAEEVIFGKALASIGRSADREQASVLVMEYIRKYGFDDEFQANYSMDFYPNRMDMHITDMDVEKMMTRLVSETKELLTNNLILLKELSKVLCDKGSLEAKEVARIAGSHNLKALVKEEGYLHIAEYYKKIK